MFLKVWELKQIPQRVVRKGMYVEVAGRAEGTRQRLREGEGLPKVKLRGGWEVTTGFSKVEVIGDFD